MRALRVLLFLAIALVTLLVAFLTVEKYRGRAAWRAYETGAKARGVKLEFAEFIPPVVPDAQNFASIPIFDAVFQAAEAKQPHPTPFLLPESQTSPRPKFDDPVRQQRIDLAAWRKYFVEHKLLAAETGDTAADVLKVLENFAAPLAQLREAGTRPHCRFPVRWERAFNAELPHLAQLMSASRLLALSVSAHLARGESAAAYEAFRDGLRLSTVTQSEPTLIAGLVRLAMVGHLESAVWGGLAGRQWAEPELRKIEADFAGLDWLKDYVFALNSERGAGNLITDLVIKDPGQLDGVFQNNADLGKYGFRAFPAGWFYQNKVRLNRFFDAMLARVDVEKRRYRGGHSPASALEDLSSLPKRIYYSFFAVVAPAVENVERTYVRAATVSDQVRLACALERFRLARGTFPQTLSELTPAFIAAVPAEVVSGEPYRYQRTDDGSFILHSVGLDLRDDGGVIEPKKSAKEQADWVWRYPKK